MFKSIYHYAAFTGQQNGNTARCQQLFPKCKASDTEFRKMAEKIFYGVDHSADDADDRADNDGDH